MNDKAHLSIEGINKIINIKSLINLGLSPRTRETQKSDFSLTLCQTTHTEKTEEKFFSVDRPIINTNNISDPNWVSGFTSAEASFDVSFRKSLNPTVLRCVRRPTQKNMYH